MKITRADLAANILVQLINSPTFYPEVRDKDVVEDPKGILVKEGGIYVSNAKPKTRTNGSKHLIKAKRKTYSVKDPEMLFCEYAVSIADKLLKTLNGSGSTSN